MGSNVTGYTVLSSERRLDPDEVSPLRQPASVRLLAVDPHELITWGLRTVLTQQPWVERCLQATDLAQAGVLAARYNPHVIMVDGSLADEGGEMHALHLASPSSRLLVMTDRAKPSRSGCCRPCAPAGSSPRAGESRRSSPPCVWPGSGSASRRRSSRATPRS